MIEDDYIVLNTENTSKSPTKIIEEKITQFQILPEGNVALNTKIEEFDITQISQPEIQTFIKRLKFTMKHYQGLGLSANQCGYKFRMFIIGSDSFQMTCINPKIIETFGEMKPLREGCLSYPALFLNVPRYENIRVEYYDEDTQKRDLTINGLTAQCFQHELEHLNGKTFTENIKPLALLMARKRQKNTIKKIIRSTK